MTSTCNTHEESIQQLPRIAVPFECHPYSWLFAKNCSSGKGLRKRVTLFPNLSESTSCSLCEFFLAEHSFVKTVRIRTHGIRDV